MEHRRALKDQHRGLGAFIALTLLLVVLASASFAQEIFGTEEEGGGGDPFDITADTVEFDTTRKVYIARGNVRLEQPSRVLTADWMVFSDTTREGVASGNVVVTEGSDRLLADVLHFEVDDLQGIVFQGKLETGANDFLATGETIKRTGEQEYLFEDAMFTTCQCPDGGVEPWAIKAKEADLEFGGYAVTKSTTFNVLGIPILWTPRMWFPIKTERETGFLFPLINFGSRSGGFDIGLPFFWAARDNINVRLIPHYLSDKGFKPETKIEYVFGRESYGEFFGSIIKDDDIDPNNPSTPFSKTRWGVEWIHDQYLPGPFEGWRWKVDGRLLSDNNYAFDFRDFSRIRGDRYVESLTMLEGRFGVLGRYGMTAAMHYAEDQQNPDDQDRDEYLIQRFPDLRLAGLPQPLAPFDQPWLRNAVFSFDTRYTHFWAQDDVTDQQPFATIVDGLFADTGIDAIPDGEERDQAGRKVLPDGTILNYDGTVTTAAEILALDPLAILPTGDGSADNFPGPEGDGRFQEGEPVVDRGHRVVLNPRVAFPFRVADAFEVMPELGWHATLYNTDAKSSAVRNLFTALLDVRTRLRRELQLPNWLAEGQPVVHLMEPRFVYSMVEGSSQRGNPGFIPRPLVQNERLRLLEPTSRVRDPSDRIDDVQAFTLALGNRFYVPGRPPLEEEGVVGPPRLFADVTLGLHHDFADDDLSSLYMDGVAYPWEGVRTRFNVGFDLDQSEFREMLFSIGYGTLLGNDIGVSYRYVKDVPRFFENFRFDEERFEEFEEGFLEINQFDFRTRYAITRNWAVTYRLSYSFEQTLVLANQVGLEYLSKCKCWAIRAEMSENRARGVEFNFRYRIIGLGDDTVRPFSGRRRGQQDSLIEDES
ncbi:MAG: LPS-assembly protein LptD [bacterium]|nr:LPS-assembly protein LptD [bacterium]